MLYSSLLQNITSKTGGFSLPPLKWIPLYNKHVFMHLRIFARTCVRPSVSSHACSVQSLDQTRTGSFAGVARA